MDENDLMQICRRRERKSCHLTPFLQCAVTKSKATRNQKPRECKIGLCADDCGEREEITRWLT
jgi:hypothetical protein